MKTWEAIDGVAWFNHYPSESLAMAGRAAVNFDLDTVALVVPALAGNRRSPKDRLLS
jgi:hypothetical protein